MSELGRVLEVIAGQEIKRGQERALQQYLNAASAIGLTNTFDNELRLPVGRV